MCGVIGYVGSGATPEFFYNGLKRLEYRGYDSAGIAVINENQVFIEKAEGKLVNLEKKLKSLPTHSQIGIGHTRWATHGRPTENNAHPHRAGKIIMLHNGIIENYKEIKEDLQKFHCEYKSETDTEVAAYLLNEEYQSLSHITDPYKRMKTALYSFVKKLKGAFGFGILNTDTPDVLYTVRYGSPIVVGLGKSENYIASGLGALVEHTQQFLILEDQEIAFIKANDIELTDFNGLPVKRNPMHVTWSAGMLDKAGYRHYMLKEIHEEPQAVAQTLLGRIERNSGQISLAALGIEGKIDLKKVDRLRILACGTSFYASQLARYYIEEFTGMPVEVELASEARYRANTINNKTLAIAVSQSGETLDTLKAIKDARQNEAQTIAIVNVPGSSIAHITHAESMIHAGPEGGVASTKAFCGQVTALLILGLALAQEQKLMTPEKIANATEEMIKIPSFIEKTLSLSTLIEKLAFKYHLHKSILFIGRGTQWPVALEGALKLKELSYIHAEAYAGGELKHGPIALIDEEMVVVCLAPKDSYYEKTFSNIEEIRARGGKILAVGTEGDKNLMEISDDFIPIAECSSFIQPFLTTVPMHLLAYWIAVKKGTDVDQPRNLAKSVTVE